MSSRALKSSAVPVVRVVDGPEFEPEQIPGILQEINDRQWALIRQILLEAKYKAESMLRADSIYDSPGKVAYYNGWVTYADYVISSFETLRVQAVEPELAPEPGPE